MIYSITFDYFSLPLDLAIIITTVKQISQVFIVIFVAIFLTKNMKKKIKFKSYYLKKLNLLIKLVSII